MKLAIFVRKDLDMRTGKIAVQVGHASVMAYRNNVSPQKWYEEGQKKIVLKVPDETTLKIIEMDAVKHHIDSYRIIDFGLTQIEPNTWTCLAIGPDEDAKIDEITKGYSLL